MHDLTPLTALGASKPRSDTIGPVTISEAPDVALASVTARLGQEAACQDALRALLGIPAPDIAAYASGPQLSAFWIGPDSWMIMAPYDTHPGLANRLTSVCKDTASVTDQTGAWARFDLTGPDLPRLMERLCNLDLAHMPPGRARRSVIDHLGCYVIKHQDGILLFAPRSAAQSLHHALLTVAQAALR